MAIYFMIGVSFKAHAVPRLASSGLVLEPTVPADLSSADLP